MAELKKMNDFPYDLPLEVEVPQTTEQPSPIAEPSEDISIPFSPEKRLRRVSTMEKIIVALLIMAAITVSVATIQLRTTISTTEKTISSIQAETETQQEEAERLEQQKSELSRTDRIKEIAEEKGLTINDDNLRKVEE